MELECFMRYIRTPSISSVGHPQPSQRMPSSHAIFGTQAFLISASLTLFALFSYNAFAQAPISFFRSILPCVYNVLQ